MRRAFAVSVCVVLVPATAVGTARRAPRARVTADVAAMEVVRVAQSAAETIATDHDGSYASVSRRTIHRLEPTIAIARNSTAWLSAASGATLVGAAASRH